MPGTDIKFHVEIKALVFIAFVIYFAPFEFIAAYLSAIVFHEAGHLFCLYFFNKKIYSVKFELKGLAIEHEGNLTAFQTMLCSAAGPAAGLLYAYVCSAISARIMTEFLSLSAGLSLSLSFFNLLPVVPLDGAMVLKSVLEILKIRNPSKVTYISSLLFSISLLTLALYLMSDGKGYGLAMMSIILLLCTLFDEGIVKPKDLR